jgi:enterochelin esterase-like enzyme
MLPARKLLLHVTMIAAASACGASLAAQVQTVVPPPVAGARPVTIERVKVHGASLEGNLEGEPADRDVIVFLPPSYGHDRGRRYPVLYALHGYFIGAEQWKSTCRRPLKAPLRRV